jgi:hypothetical protein
VKTIRAFLNNDECSRALANHTLSMRGIHMKTEANVYIQWHMTPGCTTARVEVQIPDEFEEAHSPVDPVGPA